MMQKNILSKEQGEFKWSIYGMPAVGIVITHHNYSHYLEKAIDSVLNQTYSNFQCIVVDDCSNTEHRQKLEEILSRKNDKIKRKLNTKNQGQLMTFYDGIREMDAEFYCLLDPDDEYLPTFIEEMVDIHLNPHIYVPMVCCDQSLCRNEQQITGTLLRDKMQNASSAQSFYRNRDLLCNYYVGPDVYWPWTSSSAMMFRRDALQLLKSENLLKFKRQADSYLGEGCHMLGGTIVYEKALVKRGLHNGNSSRKNHIIAITESRVKSFMPGRVKRQKEQALINIFNNRGLEYFGRRHFRKILRQEFSLAALLRVRSASTEARKLITPSRFLKIAFAKVLYSVRKLFTK